MNSKRGISVLLGAFLMMAVGLTAALLLASSFSAPSLPESDLPQILEQVRIVKVTPSEEGTYVYLLNTGSTQVEVSSLYMETPYTSLRDAFGISPAMRLGPGEVQAVFLPNYSLDPAKPMSVKVVTNEGKESSVFYMEPEVSPFVAAYLFGTGLTAVPSELDGQPTNESVVWSLLDQDGDPVVLSSNSSTYGSSSGGGAQPLNGSYVWDEKQSVNVDKYVGNHYQLSQRVTYHTLVFWSEAPREAKSLNISIGIKLTSGSTVKIVEVKLWNWSKGEYDGPDGQGYAMLVLTSPEYRTFNLSVTDLRSYIPAFNGLPGNYSVKLAVNITTGYHDKTINLFNDTTSSDAFNLNITYFTYNAFNSTYAFDIPFQVPPSNISSLSFSMVYNFTYAPVSFSFSIWDKDAMRWVVIENHTYSVSGMDSIVVSVAENLDRYIAVGSDSYVVKVNLYSPPALVPSYDISLDVFRMNIVMKPT